MQFEKDVEKLVSFTSKEESPNEVEDHYFGFGSHGLLFPDDPEYYECPYYSATLLRNYDKTPSLTSSKWFNQEKAERKQTKSKKIGSVVHSVVLESRKLKDFAPILTERERDFIPAMISNLCDNKIVLEIMRDIADTEFALYWSEGDIVKGKDLWCKAKLDAVTKKGFLFELKTCSSLGEIPLKMDQYRYDLQLSFYKRALLACRDISAVGCGIIALETSPPYDSHLFELGDRFLKRGEHGDSKYNGWRGLIAEMHAGGRPRFKDDVTVLN